MYSAQIKCDERLYVELGAMYNVRQTYFYE